MQAERSVELTGTNMASGLAYYFIPCVAIPFSLHDSRLFAGDHRGAEIPVPIPNTEVKGPIAEGSAGPARARVGRRRLFFYILS